MNLKIVAALLAGSLVLAGCHPERNPTEMQKAKQDFVCKDKGGVYKYMPPHYKAHCRDGSFVDDWRQVTLTPEYYPAAEGGLK